MKAGNDAGPVAGAILYLLIGPIVWAAHLLLVYGPQSALCAFRITGTAAVDPWLISVLVAGVTVIAMAAVGLTLWRPRRMARLFRFNAASDGDRSFVISVMRILGVLSLFGIAWAGATTLLLDPCAQLR
ncbi:hypothetical protein ATN84_11100 [Paramesorhizobium deserti]|uniref:Uncharacterized protein n=1 Tax=Paramesorhizobium deserti TaxID=1494590 RepID=A0A135HTR9_9HYPH|nr:hypothetical protein [Paramesorhizobium deserti]KXF76599.1 hypothetical protein ATN84_11100 [Paramesorhizobium deserti]